MAGAAASAQGGTAWSVATSFVEVFAPQRCVARLFTAQDDESIVLHVLRVVLQGLVCWQHAVFLSEWLGGEGREGIAAFAPLTHSVALVLGRVNTSFACLSAHLVYGSVLRTLARSEQKATGVNGNGRRSEGILSTPRRLLGGAWKVSGWVARRWCAQVFELGVWTFYYLCISQDIPWRPFPDFVYIWYKQRVGICTGEPSSKRLPMWLLSSLFVYAPANALFNWHEHPTSLCHNMAIFEALFLLSCIVAVLAGVRHCLGIRAFASLACLFGAAALASMPTADPLEDAHGRRSALLGDAEGSAAEKAVDWRLQVLPASVSRLLPACLLTAALSAAQGPCPKPVPPGRRNLAWFLAFALLVVTFAFDFLLWSQTSILGSGRVMVFKVLRSAASLWRDLLASPAFRAAVPPQLLAFVVEVPHVLGLALLVRLGVSDNEGSGGASGQGAPTRCPRWLVALSRLSLGVNLSNIFILHYLSGRAHDHPIEFSQFHLAMYTLLAWSLAALLSLVGHCLTKPFSSLAVRIAAWAVKGLGLS